MIKKSILIGAVLIIGVSIFFVYKYFFAWPDQSECETYLPQLPEQGEYECMALPELWINSNNQCMAVGCGTGRPYGFPGDDWKRMK